MSQYFVGRQPIFDRSLNSIGYELLFRASAQTTMAGPLDGDMATSRVLTNSIAEFGLDSLVGEKLAFFNLTEKFLCNPELISFLPADRVVLEILEDIPVTDEVISGATRLVRDGYSVALDDFVYTPDHQPLLKLAKLIKYDFSETPLDALEERLKIDHQAGRKVLVERIETAAEYDKLQRLGVDYFQGYFFAKPATLSTTGIPSNKITLIQLLALVNDPDTQLEEIVSVLSKDVGLVVKALRYVNSAGSGTSVKIESIQQAAALLGRNTLRNWVSVMAMAGMDDKPLQLVNMALYRAKFCELMAEQKNMPNADACFTVGMLSLLDVMTDTPQQDVLDQLTISDEIKAALLGEDNAMNKLLRQAVALERWSDLSANELEPLPESAQECYRQAILWADESMSLAD
ncbi:MAG: EAL and HDOD domain-containing protein [Granulosicoccaceae bacterium]